MIRLTNVGTSDIRNTHVRMFGILTIFNDEIHNFVRLLKNITLDELIFRLGCSETRFLLKEKCLD